MKNPAPNSPSAATFSWWRWVVCLLLMQATIINYMDRMALNQLSDRIMVAFDLSNEQYGYLESAFSFAFAIGAISIGIVVDRVGVRLIYPLMVLGWSFAGILTGFAGSFLMLLACRFMLGVFEAGNWPCGIRTTRAILPPAERSFGNSLFQSGTAAGAVIAPQAVGIILAWAVANSIDDPWRLPFRLIGSLGIIWIALWFIIVPSRMVKTTGTQAKPAVVEGAARFSDVLKDSRFWALLIMVVALNWTWHGYRSWLPLYLKRQRGYSETEMNNFSSVYYIVADIGAWTIGLTTWGLCRWGVEIHMSRMITIGFCALLALCTLAIPFLPTGWVLQAGLLVVAFSALGLFPSYFSLSQELSSLHQGKVTGTLGLVAHTSLGLVYPLEGWICDKTHSYEWVLGAIGIFPILAFVILLWFWPPERAAKRGEPQSDREAKN